MTTIKKIPVCDLLLVFVLLLVGAGVWVHRRAAHAADAVAQARAATQQTLKLSQLALIKADSDERQIVVLRMQRDSALAVAQTHTHRADVLTGQLAALAAKAPDTCRTIIITADSALSEKDSIISDTRLALLHSIAAESTMSSTNDTLRVALVQLRSTSTALVHATVVQSRFEFFKKVLPHLGFGVAGGVDQHGSPRAVAGLTLGWSF